MPHFNVTPLRFNTVSVQVSITGEPEIILTPYGYQAFLPCEAENCTPGSLLDIHSKSMSLALEPLVAKNNNKFTGLKLRIRKESMDYHAPYVVDEWA